MTGCSLGCSHWLVVEMMLGSSPIPGETQKTPVMGGKSPYTATSVTLGESDWIPKGIWCLGVF